MVHRHEKFQNRLQHLLWLKLFYHLVIKNINLLLCYQEIKSLVDKKETKITGLSPWDSTCKLWIWNPSHKPIKRKPNHWSMKNPKLLTSDWCFHGWKYSSKFTMKTLFWSDLLFNWEDFKIHYSENNNPNLNIWSMNPNYLLA